MVCNVFNKGQNSTYRAAPGKNNLNELNAGRCNEKAAAVENDSQGRKPVFKKLTKKER